MTTIYEFNTGKHTEQAHEYTNALINEAYQRKTTPQERVDNVDKLCEAHYAQTGIMPDESVLSRLAWYIVFDEMTDKRPNKVSSEEYPILSDYQAETRRQRERSISDVYTGKNDETIGRYTDHEGIKRRIYDYMTPERDDFVIDAKYLDLYNAIDSAGLTDRQRQAIALVYFEGMTQEVAGEVMGVRKWTVNEHLDGALRKLYDYMTKDTEL